MLTSKSVDIASIPRSTSAKEYDSNVENVVIIGALKEPKTVSVEGRQLAFVSRKTKEQKYIVTVKNVGIKIGQGFEVTFE